MIKHLKGQTFLFTSVFLITHSYAQLNSDVKLIVKNQVYGVFLTSQVFKSLNNQITISTKIKNTDSGSMSKLAYEIKLIGANRKNLLDTVINVPEIDSKQEDIPEYIYTESIIDGEIMQMATVNLEYLEKMEKQFSIKPKGNYVSSVSFNTGNVKLIEVKPIWATFGFSTFSAPGY